MPKSKDSQELFLYKNKEEVRIEVESIIRGIAENLLRRYDALRISLDLKEPAASIILAKRVRNQLERAFGVKIPSKKKHESWVDIVWKLLQEKAIGETSCAPL